MRLKKSCSTSSLLSLRHAVVEAMGSQLLVSATVHTACCHASAPPTVLWNPSGTVIQNKPILLQIALVMAFHHNRKVTSTMCLLVSRTKFGGSFDEEERIKVLLDDKIDHRICFKPTETTLCVSRGQASSSPRKVTSSLGKHSQLCLLPLS